MAQGQTLQRLLQDFYKKGKIWLKACSLEFDGWPNLACQSKERELCDVAVEKGWKTSPNLILAKKLVRVVEEAC